MSAASTGEPTPAKAELAEAKRSDEGEDEVKADGIEAASEAGVKESQRESSAAAAPVASEAAQAEAAPAAASSASLEGYQAGQPRAADRDVSREQLATPSGPPTISKPVSLPQVSSDMFAEVVTQYPDTPAGRWYAKRPQVGLIDENGSVVGTGCLDDVVVTEGPDCPVLRQGGDNPVFSTAGYEAMIADIAEDKAFHKSGMTPMEEKVFREYPEAYDEIKRMAIDQGILSPQQEMEQVEQMKLIVEKWKRIYKERARTREETLRKALGEKGFKNRKSTARRMGLSAKAYEDKVLAKIYAAETQSLSVAPASRANGSATR